MANEIDGLDPIPESVKLESGTVVQLESLKSRQFFKLLRILTHSALPGLKDSGLFDQEDITVDEFMSRLLTITVMAIPDAEDETIEFIRSMCYPYGLIERKGLNKQDAERNTLLWEQLDEELQNPSLQDLLSIVEAIVRREAADIQALGKRLASMFKLAQRTGQVDTPQSPKMSTSPSLVDSPERSTSSRRSTGGRTRKSQTSHSDDFASASQPSESDSIMTAGTTANG